MRSKTKPIMDAHIARLLNDKLYEKRKTGALEYVSISISICLSVPPGLRLLG